MDPCISVMSERGKSRKYIGHRLMSYSSPRANWLDAFRLSMMVMSLLCVLGKPTRSYIDNSHIHGQRGIHGTER
jgi:hypothetical protein